MKKATKEMLEEVLFDTNKVIETLTEMILVMDDASGEEDDESDESLNLRSALWDIEDAIGKARELITEEVKKGLTNVINGAGS